LGGEKRKGRVLGWLDLLVVLCAGGDGGRL
jgi:hypothetical protein